MKDKHVYHSLWLTAKSGEAMNSLPHSNFEKVTDEEASEDRIAVITFKRLTSWGTRSWILSDLR